MSTDTPTISLGNPPLKIHAQRNGTSVTGRAVFPHQANGRTECPIDYQSQRPDGATGGGEPSMADKRQAMRIAAVARYKKLCADQPTTPKIKHARQVVSEFTGKLAFTIRSISIRTLQVWVAKFDVEGEAGLRDRYTRPPKRVPTLDAGQATDAVKVCAWWSYRIGNCEVIDTRMLHTACGLLSIGYPVADILAVIECYYAYKCDRSQYPFLPFDRWMKHHFEKWLHRALEDADHRRGLEVSRAISPPPTVAGAKARRRDVLHRPTRRAIAEMAPAPPDHVSTADRTPIEASSKPPAAGSKPPAAASDPLRDAKTLQRFGFDRMAKDVVAEAAPGIPAASVNSDPKTPAEALATLDDRYRVMLLDAARGDREAQQQAVATLPLWWSRMPAAYRRELDRSAEAWLRDIPRSPGDDADAAARALALHKVQSILPLLRPTRSGSPRLGVARRLIG